MEDVKKEIKRNGEWVKVCGTSVPKHQLENARRELDELMDDQETQYLRMQKEIQDPDKEFDVHTLLYWAQIFKDNQKPELAQLASEKIEKILERNLKEDLSWESSFNVAMIYGRDLGMPEKTTELMENIVATGNFAQSVAVAELYAVAIGDRMAAGEYYRDAERMVKDMKQRCILAQSVMEYFDKEWGEDIYFWHVEKELEFPCFETLFPIIDILEELNIDLADRGKKILLELAKSNEDEIKKLLSVPWGAEYESKIKRMLKNLESKKKKE